MLSYYKQLLGITVKLLAKAPFVICLYSSQGQVKEAQLVLAAALTSTQAMDTRPVYALIYSCTCGITWVQEEGEIHIQLEQYKHLPPFPTVRTTIHTHKTTDDALIIETPRCDSGWP